MQPYALKLVQSFKAVEAVVKCYWEHTEAGTGRVVSMDNLMRAVAFVAELRIEVQEVLGTKEGGYLRGNIERYPDHVVISIKAEQDLKWKRATVAKELSHVVIDAKETDYCSDAVELIRQIVAAENGGFDISTSSAELTSEKLAEIIALELLYPVEFRRGDRAKVDANETSFAALSDEFGIPRLYVERALIPEAIEATEMLWSIIGHPEIKKVMDAAE